MRHVTRGRRRAGGAMERTASRGVRTPIQSACIQVVRVSSPRVTTWSGHGAAGGAVSTAARAAAGAVVGSAGAPFSARTPSPSRRRARA